MNFIYKLLAKYMGPSFISRASTSIVVFMTGYLAKYLPEVSPEAITKFGEGAVEIIGAALGLIVALVVDAKMSKPDEPKIIK